MEPSKLLRTRCSPWGIRHTQRRLTVCVAVAAFVESWLANPHLQTQIDADAQLARQMVEEDRAEARRYRQEQQASARGPLTYTPYIPRRTRAVSGGAQSVEAQPPSPPPKDELDQLAEGL